MSAHDEAYDLQERPPQYLYKYRSLRGPSFEFTRAIVQDHTVWFSKPSDFNDPFDCAPALSVECTDAEYDNWLKRLLRTQGRGMSRAERRAKFREIRDDPTRNNRFGALQAAYERIIPEIVNKNGILSLSAKSDDVLMWSHYADSHQGCCLRFKATGGWFRMARRVRYSADRPLLNMIRNDRTELLHKALLTKADYWAYEQEWRVINYINGSGSQSYEPASLDGIIFGPRMDAETQAKVMEWVDGRDPSVQILNAEYDPMHFRLNITAV